LIKRWKYPWTPWISVFPIHMWVSILWRKWALATRDHEAWLCVE
jgi:hypothetical protein